MTRTTRGMAGVLVFLALCEIVGRAGFVRREYLPPPSVVGVRLVELLTDRAFLLDAVATVLAAAIALLIATVAAVPIGLLLGSLPGVRVASQAVVEFLRPIPSVALIPLALIVLGGGPETKIALAVYASVWPILFNVIYALGEIDPLQLDTARTFGFTRRRILTRIAMPHAAPFAMTGVRLAAAISLIVVISTELRAPGAGGIGQFIYEVSSGSGNMDAVLAGTVVAGVVGLVTDIGFRRAQHRWLSWNDGGELAR